MKRPSKKEIKAAVEKLKSSQPAEHKFDAPSGKLLSKKSSQRIRKQGI